MKSEKELKELHGERYAKSYRKLSDYRLSKLIKYIDLKKTFDVADFGCGNGLLMGVISSKVNSYVGVDFSEPFIKDANKKKELLSIKNAEFNCSDLHDFCNKNIRKFDLGFAMDFSEHVYDKQWIEILKSIRKSMKPGGKLYLHTPNFDFFLEKMKDRNFIVKQPPYHIAVRTPEHNISLLRASGFQINHLWLVPHYNILRYIHFLSFIPIIGKYFKARILIEASK